MGSRNSIFSQPGIDDRKNLSITWKKDIEKAKYFNTMVCAHSFVNDLKIK